MATIEGCQLGSAPPISTLALTQLLDSHGTYPQPGAGAAVNTMAMVHTFAGAFTAFGAPACDGQMLRVMTGQALYSILGTSYGGDGIEDFALPNLRSLVAAGGGPIGSRTAASLSMTYMIAVAGGAGPAEYPMVGAIGLFAGINPPAGWLVADGSVLPLQQYVPLFEAIGTAFGGNGATDVQLPDLVGRAAVGAGQGPSVSIALGQQVDAGPDTPVACLGLNYLINVAGAAPPATGNGGFAPSAAVLGEVVAYAGAAIPDGWLPCDGRELLVSGNEALFGVLGSRFGGNGETSFALPDLRCNMVEGT
jgi:microcystin-dependent protein